MSADVVLTVGLDPFDLPRLCRYFSERSPQPMVAVEGVTHVVRYFNPAFARLAGKAAADLNGRPFAEAVPEGAGNRCLTLLDRVFRTGVPEYLAEQEHRQTSPAYWSYGMWAILGADDRPAGVMIQVTDATDTAAFRHRATAMNEALMVSSVRQHELIEAIERGERARRALEAHMFQVQKLESLGVMAAGVGHDLNNLLTPVIGYAELARGTAAAGSPVLAYLNEVERHTRQAVNVVQQLLSYTGKSHREVGTADLSQLVRGWGNLLVRATTPNAELRFELADGPLPVEVDATQMSQVVMNLVTNGAEAMTAGHGTVTVRTSSVRADRAALSSPFLVGNELPEGEYAVLEVADTGGGMSAGTVACIFDPFFTTKFTGRGLGLAAVLGIVRGHQGTIRVWSEPHRGTTFRILLPLSNKPVPAPPAPPQVPPATWAGSGTVLVVDDEKAVRGLVVLVLQRAGFVVLEAGDGEEGLAVFRVHAEEIRAVLTDLTMPRMSGLELATALRAARPTLPLMVMSGYSNEEAADRFAGLHIAAFIREPFVPGALLAGVRDALAPNT